jgi:hypothetical protein
MSDIVVLKGDKEVDDALQAPDPQDLSLIRLAQKINRQVLDAGGRPASLEEADGLRDEINSRARDWRKRFWAMAAYLYAFDARRAWKTLGYTSLKHWLIHEHPVGVSVSWGLLGAQAWNIYMVRVFSTLGQMEDTEVLDKYLESLLANDPGVLQTITPTAASLLRQADGTPRKDDQKPKDGAPPVTEPEAAQKIVEILNIGATAKTKGDVKDHLLETGKGIKTVLARRPIRLSDFTDEQVSEWGLSDLPSETVLMTTGLVIPDMVEHDLDTSRDQRAGTIAHQGRYVTVVSNPERQWCPGCGETISATRLFVRRARYSLRPGVYPYCLRCCNLDINDLQVDN